MAEKFSILLTGLRDSEENLVSACFSRYGHRLVAADDLTTAKEKLKAESIDFIYLRASESGRMIRELKEMLEHSALSPTVLLCERPEENLVLDAWHAGAADILFPPLSDQTLDASLQRCVKQILSRELEQSTLVPARFFYLDEAGKECWAPILPPRFTIGRSSGNNLLLSHMGISRSHAEVLVQNGEYILQDVGSKLGTFLNGNRVEQARLTNGDRVQLGGPQGISLVFRTGDLLQSLLAISSSDTDTSLSLRGFKEVGKLFAAFRALSSVPVLDDLLALVVDTAIDLTGSERGFIMLKENDGNLSFRCARNNRKRPLDGSCFQTSHRVPLEVFRKCRPIVIKDLDLGDESEDHSVTRRLGLRSICCAPLRYVTVHDSGSLSGTEHSEIIGVLYVDSPNVGTGLSDTRIDALETLASEAAMAIYNTRLYKESQDKRRMDEQLAVAHEIQQALLPHPDRELAYVRACSRTIPCHEIGGDYFDYFNLDDERFGFAVGDVAGKGMPAALLASLIQGIFCAPEIFNVPLPELISNVNHRLVQRATSNRFVTFFFGILDSEGNCTYVNAGHNPPLLLSRDGTLKELTAGGMVLGLFTEAKYEADTIRLQPGEHLIILTDGVVEAMNIKGEEFGIERLAPLLQANAKSPARQILASLENSVLSFSSGAPQHDDITMMVLGFRES